MYATFDLKIFILYKPYNFPQRNGEIFLHSQFLCFLLENVLLDLNAGAVFGKQLKPLE